MESTVDFDFWGTTLQKYKGTAEHVEVPEGTEIIRGTYVFVGCPDLKSITFPSSVTEIRSALAYHVSPISDCRNLEKITLMGRHVKLGNRIFGMGGYSGPNRILRHLPVIICAPNMLLRELKSEYKVGAVLGYAQLRRDKVDMPSEVEEQYMKYIRCQRKTIFDVAVRFPPLLEIMLEEQIILRSDFDEVWDLARRERNPEVTRMLQSYRGRFARLTTKERQARKAQATLEAEAKESGLYTAALAEKLWRFEELPDGGLRLLEYIGREKEIRTPQKISRQPVVEIGPRAFRNKRAVSIEIRKGIRILRSRAFEGCRALEEVILPQGLQMVEDDVFEGCRSLRAVVFPRGMKWLRHNSFKGCENLEKVVFPARVKHYGCFGEEHPDILDFTGCGKVTLCASAGSYIEAYAKHHNIPFEPI